MSMYEDDFFSQWTQLVKGVNVNLGDYWVSDSDDNHKFNVTFTEQRIFKTDEKFDSMTLDEKLEALYDNDILSDNDMMDYKLRKLDIDGE